MAASQKKHRDMGCEYCYSKYKVERDERYLLSAGNSAEFSEFSQ